MSCPRQKLPRCTQGPAAGGLGPCQVWPLAEPAVARWGAKPPGWGRVGAEDRVLLRPLSPARNPVRALCSNLEGPSRKPGPRRQRLSGGGQPGGWGSLSRRIPGPPPFYWVPSSQPWLSKVSWGPGERGQGSLGPLSSRPGRSPACLSPRAGMFIVPVA